MGLCNSWTSSSHLCNNFFGVRIDEISVYVRGTLMLILSIIIFIGKIVFDMEYDKRQKEKQIELLKINDNTKDIINELGKFHKYRYS